MLRRLLHALFPVLLLGSTGTLVAQEPPPPPPPTPAAAAQGGVTFGAIDAATVRVFAVRNVTQESVRGRFRQRVLGIPQAGHGTGVVVDPRGVVVTAKHVIEGARQIAVRLPGDGPVVPAKVVHVDPELDFALLLVLTSSELTAISLPESPVSLAVRETVDAIGYPFDPGRRQPQSARGIISGVLEDGHLQLDMALNPGNSGGPLLDGDERLVGIVVARADPNQGAQGIGIAVPIAPVRVAFDRARTGGALSRAYQELRARAAAAAQTAEAVDAIVRLGGVDLLQEAADFVENPEASQRIDSLRAMAERTRDADLLALLSAYFWDAAQVMVERAGGVATPDQMPTGPARQLADDLWRRAIAVAGRARDADPSVLQRSPFVGYLAGPGNGATAAAPQRWQQPGSAQSWRPQPVGVRPEEPAEPERQSWTPWILAGPSFFSGWITPSFGFGLRLGVLFPLGSGGRSTGVKFRMLAGVGADIGAWEGTSTYFFGTDIGFGLRTGGRKVAFTMFVLWSQGVQRSPQSCDDYFGGFECFSGSSYTPLGGHFGLGLRFGRVHVGVSFRVLDPGLLVGGFDLTWAVSAPQISWTF